MPSFVISNTAFHQLVCGILFRVLPYLITLFIFNKLLFIFYLSVSFSFRIFVAF